jgi:DNA (cytosine-5)-methyltransferase 1
VRKAGEVTAYYNEIDPYAAQWLRNLISAGLIAPGDVDERSIEDVRPIELSGYTQCHFFAGIGGWSFALRLAGWADSQPIWTGSCPCQPFSGAGKHAGTTDPRHLWPVFRRLIADGAPAMVFGEQVASDAGRDWLAAVRDDVEALGYAVGAADLCAASIGAPQARQRLYWVADADHEGRQRAEWQGKSDEARQAREAARSEFMRSDRGSWPPGPGEVNLIPQLANGLPGVMGGCKGYGNAIVPQVAAAFIEAVMESA